MGGRKKSRKAMAPKKKPKLAIEFDCLFCNFKKSVEVKMYLKFYRDLTFLGTRNANKHTSVVGFVDIISRQSYMVHSFVSVDKFFKQKVNLLMSIMTGLMRFVN